MERVKVWTAVDRNRNKVITSKVSKDSNQNDKIICRSLLEEIKNNKVLINIIATDGNYSYDKVINKGYNTDCNKHIISKSETCLVECYNGSLRGRFARFNRRTKAYSKSFDNLKDTVFMWIHREYLLKNRNRYIRDVR